MSNDDKNAGNGAFDFYELSNLTKRQLLIWVGQKLAPAAPVYNMLSTLTIDGEIDPAVLEKAIQQLLRECDALRTVIEEFDGIPRQQTLSHPSYSLEFFDFSEEPDPAAAFEIFLKQRSAIPLDMKQKLFDFVLVKIASKRFIIYANQHHIIIDGRSSVLVLKRLAELYECFAAGRTLEPRDVPTFKDYIAVERGYRHSVQSQKSELFWRQKLAEPFEPTTFYGKTPLTKTTGTQRTTCHLGAERSAKLKALCRSKEVGSFSQDQSLYAVFVALLFTYLFRISGKRALAIGSTFHNRLTPGFRETIGLFMEVSVLQADIEDDDTFLTVLNKVKRGMFEVLRHSQYGIENATQRPAYDVMLNFPNAAMTEFAGFPSQFDWPHSGHGESNTSLAVNFHDFNAAGEVVLDFDFNCDVFNAEQRERALQHFLNILDSFVDDLSMPIAQINLLSECERRLLIEEWNKTEAAYPADLCVHNLFEEQAAKTPDSVAVVFENEQLTYKELNRRANQLAHHLRSLGVGPEVLVGICVDRSLEMLVGLMGILKAGGAYVPLDPIFPRERLAQMLEDSQLPVLLTQEKLIADLPEYQARLVVLDKEWDEISKASGENLSSEVKPENLAYVIYTSGSTGKPKGVQICHGAVVNFLESVAKEPGLKPDEVLMAVTTLSFDISILELFLPLSQGARVVVASREVASDGNRLAETLSSCGATVMQATPATWRMLLEAGWQGRSELKMFCGGEALPQELADQLLQRGGSLWNMYGPTETTIWSALGEIAPNRESINIGPPIANTELYVLDKWSNPTPIGVAGELCIGGAGLARGYLGRPELTAEKFVPDSFSGRPGARLYRTGDLVRYVGKGAIEFIGRIDHQVKVRGFRIELGEIETVLGQHPEVKQALVMVREDVPGDKRLVAYLISQQATPSVSALRSFLREKLPEYMVPSAFVFLDEFPLTPNGKINRRALPKPDEHRPELDAAFVAPQTEVEINIAAAWQEVLNVQTVGVDDNFFDLGGHSLLMMRVHYKLRDRFSRELSIVNLFQYPTIRSLSKFLNQSQDEAPRAYQKIRDRAAQQREALARRKQLLKGKIR